MTLTTISMAMNGETFVRGFHLKSKNRSDVCNKNNVCCHCLSKLITINRIHNSLRFLCLAVFARSISVVGCRFEIRSSNRFFLYVFLLSKNMVMRSALSEHLKSDSKFNAEWISAREKTSQQFYGFPKGPFCGNRANRSPSDWCQFGNRFA